MADKLVRKEGITYFECEHISKWGFEEVAYLWLGDNTRAALCPLCVKREIGNMTAHMLTMNGASRRKIRKVLNSTFDWMRKFVTARIDEIDKQIAEAEKEEEST